MPRRIAGRYYTDFRFEGKRIRHVLPEARTLDQAKRAEARLRDEYFEGSYGNTARATGFVAFAEKVWLPWSKANKKSWRDDVSHFKVLKVWFGSKTFAEISPLLLEKFKRERLNTPTHRGTPRTPAAVNRELECISKIFRLATQQKITTDNPMLSVKHLIEDNQRTRFLAPDEEQRLLAALALRPELKAIIVIAINTGLRKSEILKLQWRDLEFATGMLHVRESKTGYSRSVPMNADVLAALQALPKTAAWLFPSDGATGHLVEIKKGFKAALDEADITNFRFHDLRHTTGSRLAAVGVHPMLMMEIMGHRSIQTTKRYTHMTDDAKRQAMAALAQFKPESAQVYQLNTKAKIG